MASVASMIPSPDLLNWLRELPSRRAVHMLRLIAALLHKHGERSWDDRLAEAARLLAPLHDAASPSETADVAHRILGFFDEGASLRDVRLSDRTDHKIRTEDIETVNARLGALTMQLLLSAHQTIARIRWQDRSSQPRR